MSSGRFNQGETGVLHSSLLVRMAGKGFCQMTAGLVW